MKRLGMCLALSLFCEMGYASWFTKKEVDGKAPSSFRAGVRHIEGKGIGYTKGYTTFEFFAAPSSWLDHDWIPVVDARAHVFDNGRWAANFGVGARYLSPFSYVIGMHGYYDYRNTSRQDYHQVSIGWEALGKVWDFRLSGYLPVGAKSTGAYHPKFAFFKGHHAYLRVTSQGAMKGLTSEAGIHIKKMKNMAFYGAFGPYYFERKGDNAIGGKARISATFLDALKVELSGSYDPVFHGIIQGEVGVNIAFGPRKRVKKQREGMLERALVPAYRQEIIVVDKQNKNQVAIDPITNKPYNFIFVNNLSHSDGSYESPYHLLQSAQDVSVPHDVIYVFSGDGTTRDLDTGFVLKDYQRLWGSGTAQQLPTTLGEVTVPKMTTDSPHVTFTSNERIIRLANQTEVSGMVVVGDPSVGFGIYGENLSSAIIIHNTIQGNILVNGIAAFQLDSLNISDNQFIGTTGGSDIYAEKISYMTVSRNLISSSSTNRPGIEYDSQERNSCLRITENEINSLGNDGILIQSHGSRVLATVAYNTVVNSQVNSSVLLSTADSGSICADIFLNTLDQKMAAAGTGPIFVGVFDNTQGFSSGSSYTPVPLGSCDCE